MTAPVTQAFRDAYVLSHVVAVRGVLTDYYGNPVGDNDLSFDRYGTNSVQVDVTAINRRSATLTLTDPDGVLIPVVADSALALTNEITLWRGIAYADGTEELVPLGIFGIQTAEETDVGAGPAINVTAIDRSKRLDVVLTEGLTFAAGTNFGTYLTALIAAADPNFAALWPAPSYDAVVLAASTPAISLPAGTNIWDEFTKTATALGCRAFFDTDGTPTVALVPDPSTTPVAWTYEAGSECTFDTSDRRLALEEGSQRAYSHAVVTAQPHSGAVPLRGDAFDTNPGSPTYYLGPFGDRAVFDQNSSGYITTQPQVDAAAAALLRKNYGLLERLTLEAAPNPALEGDDIMQIADPMTDTNGVYVTESFPIPLFAAGGKQTLVCRTRQVVS